MVELASHLPLEYRVGKRADKWVLKQVARRYLPADLVERKKMGFPLPLADYLAPFATMEFFQGGFWLEHVGLRERPLRESLATARDKPFAFLALVSGEIWGRMTFEGRTALQERERIHGFERG